MIDDTELPESTPLTDALTYPIRESGWAMVLIGAGISVVAGWLTGTMYLGLIVSVLGLAYFNAFYFSIVETTVSGKDETPDWPDITNNVAEDLLLPLLRTLRVAVLSLLPLLVILYFRDDPQGMWLSPMVWLGVLWCAFYFPMAMINTVVSNDMRMCLPHKVLPLILGNLREYLVLVSVLLAGFMLSKLVSAVIGGIPLIGTFLSAGTGLYFMMAEARLAGLFYLNHVETEENGEAV